MTDSEKLDLILLDMQELKSDVGILKDDVGGLKDDVRTLKNDVASLQELKGKVTAIENKVTDINLTLENEIRVNIKRVAEGHLDLSRNLHDAMKPNNEIEMLAIKVRMLETDVKDLKAKFA